jgi:L,D-peptidoglycan transpeptidase YkuD (ErfK/YbiS/YcfS/YnhG family)
MGVSVRKTLPRASALVTLIGVLASAPAPAFEQTCPAPLDRAQRVLLVTARNMKTFRAVAQLFERTSVDAPWRPVQGPEPAVVGLSGMAWGRSFKYLTRHNEPLKSEADKRTPAGVYAIGRSFGFAASSRPGYLHLKAGETVCVDDPSSPAYNTITSRREVGLKVRGEDMRRMELYRRGLVVSYPTDAATKAGSCIFIHVWRSPERGTAGCIAFPEARVAALQGFADKGATVVAVLPQSALDRFPLGCLPKMVAAVLRFH